MQDEAAIPMLVSRLLEKPRPGTAFVFDARAIKDLYAIREKLEQLEGRVVVTPHADEMAGLTNLKREQVEADPISPPRLKSPRPTNSPGKRSSCWKVESSTSTYLGVAMPPSRTGSPVGPSACASALASR